MSLMTGQQSVIDEQCSIVFKFLHHIVCNFSLEVIVFEALSSNTSLTLLCVAYFSFHMCLLNKNITGRGRSCKVTEKQTA